MNESLKLVPLDSSGYPMFFDTVVKMYADESAKAGRVAEERAMTWSQNENQRILHAGLSTPGHYFYTVSSESNDLYGYLWIGADPDHAEKAHLYVIYLFEEYRNKGIGRKALHMLFDLMKDKGYCSLGLHVYAFNENALHVYKNLGFEVTSYIMKKVLE